MQKLKVLIADDNPRMASMIQNILMDAGELSNRVPYDKLVDTEFAQEVKQK